MKNTHRRCLGWLTLAIVVGLGAHALSAARPSSAETDSVELEFTDVRRQTLEFIAYNRLITLTAEEDAVMREALSEIPAPCCADRTAHTCCCPCNMAKAWWGLAKHLIAERGFNANQVRDAVASWIKFINPDGFTGNACYTGGCSRPFHRNGCGGMNETGVVF